MARREVADVALDLEISEQSVYVWRHQDRIDRGPVPGLTSGEKAEFTAAKQNFAKLDAEMAINRRASKLLGDVVPPTGGSR